MSQTKAQSFYPQTTPSIHRTLTEYLPGHCFKHTNETSMVTHPSQQAEQKSPSEQAEWVGPGPQTDKTCNVKRKKENRNFRGGAGSKMYHEVEGQHEELR